MADARKDYNKVNDDEPHVFIIDPTNMTPREAAIATQFLMHHCEYFLGKGVRHGYGCTPIPLFDPDLGRNVFGMVQFSYDLALYRSDKHAEQRRFAVVGNTLLGRGGSCHVWKVKGRLKPSSTGALFYQTDKDKPKDKKRAVRYESRDSDLTADAVVTKYRLSRINKKLGFKHTLWTCPSESMQKTGVSVGVMRRLKDYDLARVIEINGFSPGYLDDVLTVYSRWDLSDILVLKSVDKLNFSNQQILRYCHAIAVAYREQVQSLGLVHRDVKPENIVIDLAKGPVPEAVTLLDYDDAVQLGGLDKVNMICGTPGYMAPEAFVINQSISDARDIFSLACTLAQWFGDESALAIFPDDDAYGYQQSSDRRFDGLSPETPDSIHRLLHQMVAPNAADRPDIEEVIDLFWCEIDQQERLGVVASPSLGK